MGVVARTVPLTVARNTKLMIDSEHEIEKTFGGTGGGGGGRGAVKAGATEASSEGLYPELR